MVNYFEKVQKQAEEEINKQIRAKNLIENWVISKKGENSQEVFGKIIEGIIPDGIQILDSDGERELTFETIDGKNKKMQLSPDQGFEGDAVITIYDKEKCDVYNVNFIKGSATLFYTELYLNDQIISSSYVEYSS